MKLGPLIGEGKGRRVFAHPEDHGLVIKVARPLHPGKPFTGNEVEWMLWQAVCDTEYAIHFAPCIGMTEDGHLLMRRCEPVRHRRKSPLKILDVPLRGSVKASNRGRLGTRIVTIDYADLDAVPLIVHRLRVLRND